MKAAHLHDLQLPQEFLSMLSNSFRGYSLLYHDRVRDEVATCIGSVTPA